MALPAASRSLSYYKLAYQARWFQPLIHGFIFSLMGNVNYGNQFSSRGLPVYENYFAGGIAQPGQVRGYQSFSLGPKDNNFNANGSASLILPYPLSRDMIRTSMFFDMGNVFSVGTPIALRGSQSGPLRYSAGVAFEWRSPFGPLAFSLAKPLNLQPGDEQTMFQFTLSSGF